jgi:hypothetical protein
MYIVTYQTEGKEIGRILSCAFLPEEFHHEDHIQEGLYLDEQPNYSTDYVDGDVIGKRPASTATLEGNVLSGLVVGGKLTIVGTNRNVRSYDLTAETATLNFPLPGTYKVIVEAWPMLEKEFEITI